MPVTKKRGAIFAIYADSPVKTPPRAGASAAPGKSAQLSARATALSGSPSKLHTAVPRRALAAIQPSRLQVLIPEPSANGENAKIAKPEKSGKNANHERGALIEKSSKISVPPLRTSSALKSTSSKTVSKRQFEIFTPPSPEAKPSALSPSPKRPAAVVRPAAKSAASGSKPPPSPPKRLRCGPSEDKNEEEGQDDFKENCPPISGVDSPASRTRSRTTAPALAQSRPRHSKAPVMRDLQAEDVLREGQPFVGDGRGTLSLKKGRSAAGVLARALPLSDISRQYGATGIEPQGFKVSCTRPPCRAIR